MQNHTTSLELSKRLKELGVPQVSEFYHTENAETGAYMAIETAIYKSSPIRKITNYSAFLASELWNLLPMHIENQEGKQCHFESGIISENKLNRANRMYYIRIEGFGFSGMKTANNLPDALGIMLCYLLENNIITLNSLNK